MHVAKVCVCEIISNSSIISFFLLSSNFTCWRVCRFSNNRRDLLIFFFCSPNWLFYFIFSKTLILSRVFFFVYHLYFSIFLSCCENGLIFLEHRLNSTAKASSRLCTTFSYLPQIHKKNCEILFRGISCTVIFGGGS